MAYDHVYRRGDRWQRSIEGDVMTVQTIADGELRDREREAFKRKVENKINDYARQAAARFEPFVFWCPELAPHDIYPCADEWGAMTYYMRTRVAW